MPFHLIGPEKPTCSHCVFFEWDLLIIASGHRILHVCLWLCTTHAVVGALTEPFHGLSQGLGIFGSIESWSSFDGTSFGRLNTKRLLRSSILLTRRHLIEQTFAEHLPWARQYSRCWGYSRDNDRWGPCSHEAVHCSLRGREGRGRQ